jgi:hypothetical protein
VIAGPLGRDYLGMGTLHDAARVVALAAFLAFACPLRAALAQTPDAPDVAVAYTAGDGCPSGAEFGAAVAARGRTIHVGDDGRATAHVSIAPDPAGGYRGTLRMGASDPGTRDVHGASCREVVDALAVVMVSSLGPAGSTAVSPPASDAPSGAPPRSKEPEDPPSPPAAAAPAVPSGHVSIAPREVTVGPGTLRFDHDMAISGYGGVTSGIVPSAAMPWVQLELTRTNVVRTPDGQSYHTLPTVRLHLDLFLGADYHSRYGTTSTNGFGVGADICRPLYYDETGFQFLFCAEFTVGYFGLKTTSPQGVDGPVALEGLGMVGPALDLVYNIGRHFNVGLKAGGDVVFGPLEARASDGSQIFESSRFTMNGMFGLGGHF